VLCKSEVKSEILGVEVGIFDLAIKKEKK
jgi:hypothetical protein